MKFEIETVQLIEASAEKVWQEFTRFETFPQWNPFIKSFKGRVEVGQIIEVDLPGMRFKPRVLAFQENTEFRWRGKVWFTGVFDGEHYFKLIPQANGSTLFVHGEKFSGFLVRLFKRKLETDIKKGFIAMNLALKNRVEN